MHLLLQVVLSCYRGSNLPKLNQHCSLQLPWAFSSSLMCDSARWWHLVLLSVTCSRALGLQLTLCICFSLDGRQDTLDRLTAADGQAICLL